mmetsp:Transcript_27388/g.35692  ORF Transcript_27388/g.35692 Transcript_27388/m.35692 type:complete len:97 (+) Transcript_27388:265-555(+)
MYVVTHYYLTHVQLMSGDAKTEEDDNKVKYLTGCGTTQEGKDDPKCSQLQWFFGRDLLASHLAYILQELYKRHEGCRSKKSFLGIRLCVVQQNLAL